MKKIFKIAIPIFSVGLLIFLAGISVYFGVRTVNSSFTAEELIEVNRTLNNEYISSSFKIQLTFHGEFFKRNITGSAFVYKKDNDKYYLLTNKHVIEDVHNDWIYQDCKVYDYQDEVYDFEIEAISETEDLAVLSFKSDKEYKVLALNESKVSKRDKAYNISNALGFHNRIEFGYIKTIMNDDTILADIETNLGSSGSALLNQKYEVVGVVFSIYKFQDVDYTGVIPSLKVVDFLSENGLN